jgi:hypothetical protein
LQVKTRPLFVYLFSSRNLSNLVIFNQQVSFAPAGGRGELYTDKVETVEKMNEDEAASKKGPPCMPVHEVLSALMYNVFCLLASLFTVCLSAYLCTCAHAHTRTRILAQIISSTHAHTHRHMYRQKR